MLEQNNDTDRKIRIFFSLHSLRDIFIPSFEQGNKIKKEESERFAKDLGSIQSWGITKHVGNSSVGDGEVKMEKCVEKTLKMPFPFLA